MISKKVHLSLSEEEVAKFDMLRNELGMNRSQYFCYLLTGQKKQMPDSIRYKNLIAKLSDIDCYPAFYLILNHATFNQIKKGHSINYSDGFFIGLLYAMPLVLS